MESRKAVVLVVDDETHILHVVSLKLRNAGFEVHTAEDGEEGLEMALRHQPDLIVTDFQMPFLSGLEMCQQLKLRHETAAVPALMLTARGFSMPTEMLTSTNIVDVMSKPFSPREILEKVEELTGSASGGPEISS